MGIPTGEPAGKTSQGTVIVRDAAFRARSEELSRYIVGLALGEEQNNQLIRLIIAQVQAAEENAFRQGVVSGIRYVKDRESMQ